MPAASHTPALRQRAREAQHCAWLPATRAGASAAERRLGRRRARARPHRLRKTGSPESSCAVSRPPSTRIVVSNTEASYDLNERPFVSMQKTELMGCVQLTRRTPRLAPAAARTRTFNIRPRTNFQSRSQYGFRDRGLFDRRAPVKRERVGHPVARAAQLRAQAQHPQRVQRVDNGRTQAAEWVLAAARQGLQLVRAHRERLVARPGVPRGRHHRRALAVRARPHSCASGQPAAPAGCGCTVTVSDCLRAACWRGIYAL